MPMLDAPGSRKEVDGAEAARLQAYDVSVRSLLEIVRSDRLGPVSIKALPLWRGGAETFSRTGKKRPVITGQYGVVPPGLIPRIRRDHRPGVKVGEGGGK
jgi:hypothetical protein